ncbi:hypothetical protein [Thermodesulfovibrio thiophilus]|uniref:hypothetical protein n=1 Tax=Thermodesulfovibrio thiophilus TaxID=340095 RepID=UPI00040BB52A|nr:hypothetical protein [Thermodesulfovibrio thiophilus]
MRGMPKWLNSKEDVLNVVGLASDGQLSKSDVKKKINDLLSDERVYNYKAEVSSDYQPGENEKVMTEKHYDGTEKIVCYELVENMYARYIQLGFTKDEIISLLSSLED